MTSKKTSLSVPYLIKAVDSFFVFCLFISSDKSKFTLELPDFCVVVCSGSLLFLLIDLFRVLTSQTYNIFYALGYKFSLINKCNFDHWLHQPACMTVWIDLSAWTISLNQQPSHMLIKISMKKWLANSKIWTDLADDIEHNILIYGKIGRFLRPE